MATTGFCFASTRSLASSVSAQGQPGPGQQWEYAAEYQSCCSLVALRLVVGWDVPD